MFSLCKGDPFILTLVSPTTESIVEVLAGLGLGPLCVRRLLASTVSAGAGRPGVTHGLGAVPGR